MRRRGGLGRIFRIEKTDGRQPLPAQCAACGAPLNPGNLRWHNPQTAECQYCGNVIRVS